MLFCFCVCLKFCENVITNTAKCSTHPTVPGALKHMASAPSPSPAFDFSSLFLAPGNSLLALAFKRRLCNLNRFTLLFLLDGKARCVGEEVGMEVEVEVDALTSTDKLTRCPF